MIALKYRDVSLVEAYAPVNCSRKEVRENFFPDLLSALAGLTLKTKGILLLGDFNAHVKGFASEETNSNGEILLRTLRVAGLNLLGLNEVTFLGRNGIPTCIDNFAISRNMKEMVTRQSRLDNTPTGSDHVPITTTLMLSEAKRTSQKKSIKEVFRVNLLHFPDRGNNIRKLSRFSKKLRIR